MATGDFIVIKVQFRVIYCAPNHLVWTSEVVLVVAVGTSESGDRSHCISTPAGSTGPLLVIGSSRGHVSE